MIDSLDLLPLLVRPEGDEPEDVFVEDTVIRLVNLLHLPVPDELTPR